MKHALEGSQAIAQAVALCRPDVVAAYLGSRHAAGE